MIRPSRGDTDPGSLSPDPADSADVSDVVPAFCPPRRVRDDLSLLRAGMFGPHAMPRPIALPDELRHNAIAQGRLVLTDPEGVHLVELTAVKPVGAQEVTGEMTWLGIPSSRPFASWHLEAPIDLTARNVVVVTAPVDLVAAPPGAYLLVVAATSVEGRIEGNDLVRLALQTARTHHADVAVVPVDLSDQGRCRELADTLGLDATARRALVPPGRTSTGRGSGLVVFLSGLSGSGKSTLSRAAAHRLIERGERVTLLDGDLVRRHLSAGLGFSPADRDANIRRIGWVAAELAFAGGLAICAAIAPSQVVRAQVAQRVLDRGGQFLLVHVATPLNECERRDRKGLYAAARRGELVDFTGVSAPYDIPHEPDLRIDTTGRSVGECVNELLSLIESRRRDQQVGGVRSAVPGHH